MPTPKLAMTTTTAIADAIACGLCEAVQFSICPSIYFYPLGVRRIEHKPVVSLLDDGVQVVVSQEIQIVDRPTHALRREIERLVTELQRFGLRVVARAVSLDM